MRPIAEFVMRGRSQALIMAVLSIGTAYFYWFGAAVIGLVTLRKGVAEGVIILLWSMLPAAALLIWLHEFMPLGTVLATTAACIALRLTISWRINLLVLMVCGYLTATALVLFADEYLASIVEIYQQFLTELQKGIGENDSNAAAVLANIPVNEQFVAGIFGVMQTVTGFISCVLARWWQSMLYNPGGFQQEFHHIQMPPAIAIALVVLAAVCLSSGSGMISWAAIACIPLLIAGIALVHGIAGQRRLRTHWLVVFYVLLMAVDELKLFLVVLAFVDSFVGFRQRLQKPPGIE